MAKPSFWQVSCALFVVCAVTAIGSSAQTLTTLASFNKSNGSGPYTGPLAQGVDGNFYGTTVYGGTNCYPYGCGTVFKLSPQGTLTTLYSFCAQSNCTDGIYPYGGLVLGIDGNLYGTTSEGGTNIHAGTIFKISPTGKLTTIYSFCAQINCTDGNYPTGRLVQGADGNFYGTTFSGGLKDAQYCASGCGTVFEVTPKGTLTLLHSFAGFDTEGSNPNAGLVQGKNGAFYGTTEFGGVYNLSCNPPLGCGTVFEITRQGTLTTLYSFAASSGDGTKPYAGLLYGTDGKFYGTTSEGGTGDDGTIFEIKPSGMLATIYNFCSQPDCTDGGDPVGDLIEATDGNLYGTAARGGAKFVGSIFRLTAGGRLTTLYSFCAQGYPDCPDGSFVYGGLLQATDGNFYGTTNEGGDLTCNSPEGCGTVFRLDASLGPFVRFLRNPARVGQMFGILGNELSGTTGVSLNGTPASFKVVSDTFIKAIVPAGATTGFVTVATPSRTLTSNVPFHVVK